MQVKKIVLELQNIYIRVFRILVCLLHNLKFLKEPEKLYVLLLNLTDFFVKLFQKVHRGLKVKLVNIFISVLIMYLINK